MICFLLCNGVQAFAGVYALVEFGLFPGVQTSDVDTSVTGLRFGVACSNRKMYGLDVSLFGITKDSFAGIGVGLANINHQNQYGITAGVFTFTKKDLWGLSLGALTITGDLYGIQAGILNYVDNQAAGIQIGIVNICTNDIGLLQIGFINGVDAGFMPMPQFLEISLNKKRVVGNTVL